MNTFADGSLAVQHSLAKLFTFRWQFTGEGIKLEKSAKMKEILPFSLIFK